MQIYVNLSIAAHRTINNILVAQVIIQGLQSVRSCMVNLFNSVTGVVKSGFAVGKRV